MNTRYFTFFILSFFIAFSSCNKHSKKADKIFKEVKSIVEQNPDSALILLDSIRNPYELNKKQHAEYIVLSVQAKDKTYKDISADTLIFRAKDFFQKANDSENLALSEFYCGRVSQAKGEAGQALKFYLRAETEAEHVNNFKLRGLIQYFIGETNYNDMLYDEAILKFKEAVASFSKTAEGYKSVIVSLNHIGVCFMVKKQQDSAFVYFDNALSLAKEYNDSSQEASTLQNIGVCFSDLKKTVEAKKLFQEALFISSEESERAKIYMNLARVYNDESKPDSAAYFAHQSLKSIDKQEDAYGAASVYRFLSKIEENSGNYKQALDYHKEYTAHLSFILKAKENSDLLNVQKKYDFELIKNANNKLVIEKQGITITSLLVIFLISIGAFLLYRKKEENKKDLMMAKEHIYQLKEFANIQPKPDSEKSNKLRRMLIQRLDIFKRIALLENFLHGDEKSDGKLVLKKVNEIIYGNRTGFEWKVMLDLINESYDDFAFKINKAIPDLNEAEFRLCCLSKAGFNDTEISILLETTVNAIQLRKRAIRKKTGMTMQVYESFVKELDKLVDKKTF